ncbi:hypothetical protein BCO26_2137 [Heyndrickxia coagulans 2-6]|nr:hypothetical protein BCO26_2137 [Heyndrickxia coagulans 2-6]
MTMDENTMLMAKALEPNPEVSPIAVVRAMTIEVCELGIPPVLNAILQSNFPDVMK